MSPSREFGLCILAIVAGITGAVFFFAILAWCCIADFCRRLRPNHFGLL